MLNEAIELSSKIARRAIDVINDQIIILKR